MKPNASFDFAGLCYRFSGMPERLYPTNASIRLSRVLSVNQGFHTGSVSLGDNGLPDANIDNARLDVLIRPIVLNGRLTYQVVSSNFNANIQATGACDVLGIDICKRFFDYKGELTSQVESQVRSRLNDPALRDRIGTVIQPVLNPGQTHLVSGE